MKTTTDQVLDAIKEVQTRDANELHVLSILERLLKGEDVYSKLPGIRRRALRKIQK